MSQLKPKWTNLFFFLSSFGGQISVGSFSPQTATSTCDDEKYSISVLYIKNCLIISQMAKKNCETWVTFCDKILANKSMFPVKWHLKVIQVSKLGLHLHPSTPSNQNDGIKCLHENNWRALWVGFFIIFFGGGAAFQ